MHTPFAQPPVQLVTKARVVPSIREIGAAAWNACFPGEIEDYGYLLAIEDAGIAQVRFAAVVVEEAGVPVAAMPLFAMDYPLDVTLDPGMLRRSMRAIRRVFPSFLVVRMCCLGSPETECARVGFHPDIAAQRQPELLQQLLAAFAYYAQQQGASLLAVKDAAHDQEALWQVAAPEYVALPGAAIATLPITFATREEYLALLSKATRKDIRRKLRAAAGIRVEHRTQIADVLPQMMPLYHATVARSTHHLRDLTAAYFTGVLEHMPGRAWCTLYWEGETLIGFNLLLQNGRTLLDKFFCMDERGRDYQLYYVSWMDNIAWCLQHGLQHYQSGQAGYATKLRLKSALLATRMRFRHRRRWLHALMRAAAPLFAMGDET